MGQPPRLNQLASGLPCPTCRDRILDETPAALPTTSPNQATPLRLVREEPVLGRVLRVDFGGPGYDEPA